MPERHKHMENRGIIESVLRHIPGFRGYLEKEYRRESDTLLREMLSDRLKRSKRTLDHYTRALAEAAQLDDLPQFDRTRGRIDKFDARIRGAMKGYSGFFDLVHVDEADLDRVYAFDASLVDSIDQFADDLEKIDGRDEPPAEIAKEFLDRLEEFEQAWDRREDILKGVD